MKSFILAITTISVYFLFLGCEKEDHSIVSVRNIKMTYWLHNKAAAFTFDDSHSDHAKVAEILNNNGFTGTFFINPGIWQNGYKQMYLNLIANGNEIGNHTYDHQYLSKLNTIKIVDEITRAHDSIVSWFNYYPVSFAHPYNDASDSINNLVPSFKDCFNIPDVKSCNI